MNPLTAPFDSAAQSCNHVSMQTNTLSIDNPLTAAAEQLREICRDHQTSPPSFDSASVGRIIVHITNINRSVIASTQDRCNAAKRLNDFATVFDRVTRNIEPQSGALAVRMTSVANNLRAASQELASNDAIPGWRAPDSPTSAGESASN